MPDLSALSLDELIELTNSAAETIRAVREERNRRRGPVAKIEPTRSLRRDEVEPNFGKRMK